MSYPEGDTNKKGSEVVTPQHDFEPLELDDPNVLEALARNPIFKDVYQRNKAIIEAIARDETSARIAITQSALLLLEMAGLDPLIEGFRNRRGFYDQLNKEMARARREGRVLSVITFDLDGFKGVNDTYGHPEGDATLQRVGSNLKEFIRVNDSPARMGGDEFAVILPDTSAIHALIPAIRLLDTTLAATPTVIPIKPDLPPVTLTASIGIAQASNKDTSQSLFSKADRAVYSAKRIGNTICLATEEKLSPQDLRRILETDESLAKGKSLIPRIMERTIILPSTI